MCQRHTFLGGWDGVLPGGASDHLARPVLTAATTRVRIVLVSRRSAVLIVAAALGLPAAAEGQTLTAARGGADVSNTPPVPLASGRSDDAANAGAERGGARMVASSELPNTGSDPRVLFLCGVALTLLGVGLRLRTADADLY